VTGYRSALDVLFARTTGPWKFGLERTAALLAALGDPHLRYPVFHVGGTNGKGSVCATLRALLEARGLRVGLYSSPHLVDFRERFTVGGHPVAEEAVVEFIERTLPTIGRLGATFFESTTALAFEHFARAEVDVAIVEVGLGGRLDSTNVVRPVVATVTTIGRDHVEYLGESLEEIADEKAGIFKSGAAAVVGEPEGALRARLARRAADAGSAPIRVLFDEGGPRDVTLEPEGTRFTHVRGGRPLVLRTPLVGAHQAANAATALLALDAAGGAWRPSDDEAARGLAAVRLPGRFHRHGRYIFDVAHNPDGAAVLARTVAAVAPPAPRVALLCVLGDKDWRGMMAALAPVVDGFVLTQAPTAPASRAWSPDEAGAHARSRGWRAEVVADFDAAIARASSLGETVLVTGSFHTAGDAMARLQVSPLAG
jgi:dihydrofolate synthase / folylpolyglutamate synthase